MPGAHGTKSKQTTTGDNKNLHKAHNASVEMNQLIFIGDRGCNFFNVAVNFVVGGFVKAGFGCDDEWYKEGYGFKVRHLILY